MAASLPQDLATQLKYGPTTGSALRRSQYLADALKQMGASGGQNIQSGGELAAKLLATAILNKAGKSADRDALTAIRDQQGSETETLLASLRPPTMAPPPVTAPVAPPQAPQTLATPQSPPLPAPEPQAPPQASPMAFNASPEDLDALTRMLATEAIGEGPEGMAAAGHVALNRLKNGYGGAKSIREVVFAPHQFEGMSRANQVSPEAYAKAGQVADAILSGQAPDPTGGAMAFLNPDLQVKMGRSIPKWAAGGDGNRIGNHVFFGGQPSAQPRQVAQGPAPLQAPAPPIAGGAGADTLPPSAPVASPPAAGTGPVAEPPQAPAAGPTSQGITPEQLGFLEKLLRNPQTHDAGMAYAMELQKKAAEPLKYDTTTVNGLPMQANPYTGEARAIRVPDEARTRVLPATQAGLPNAPQGLYVQQTPLGQLSEAPGGPPQGYQAGPGGQLQFQPGGPADPTRAQPAPSGYQYAPGGAQAPIQGGPADPRNPMNVIEGTQRFAGQIKTIVDSAMKVKQNYGAVITGYRQQNGTGDIAMTNGLQKLIDDGVVKGEDVNMQMKSNGLSGTLGGLIQYANSGGLFTPEVRTKLKATADGLYQNLDRTYQVRVQSMKGPVEEAYGPGTFGKYVFPDAFAAELGWTGERPAAAPTAGGDGRPTEAQHRAIQQYKGSKSAGGTEFNPSVVMSQAQYDALKPGTWFIDDDGAKVQKRGGR